MKEGLYYRSEGPECPSRLTRKELARRIAEVDRARVAQETARCQLAVLMPLIEADKIDEARAALDRFASEAGKPTRDEHCRRYISWAGGDWLIHEGLNAWDIACPQCPAYGLCQVTEYVRRFQGRD